MEKVSFDPNLEISENLELVLQSAENADPELAKILRGLAPLMLGPISDAERRTMRSTFNAQVKTELDHLLTAGTSE